MNLSQSQQQLIDILKRRGPQSIRILARKMAMTPMGVRQHMTDLAARQLVVARREEKQVRGRPVQLWQLTRQGHRLFPDKHDELLVDIVESLKNSPEAINQVISHWRNRLAERYSTPLLTCDSLSARMEMLRNLRSDDGFMAEVRLLPDAWLFVENHCPISQAASACDKFCSAELDMLQSLLQPEASVQRIEHIRDGDRRCAFKIVATNNP